MSVPPPLTAVLLAGGRSSRMGRDKAEILLPDGRPLWRRQLDDVLRPLEPAGIFLSGPARGGLPADVRVLPDAAPGLGPLSGIAAALGAAVTPLVVVLAVDPARNDRGIPAGSFVARLHDGARRGRDRPGRFLRAAGGRLRGCRARVGPGTSAGDGPFPPELCACRRHGRFCRPHGAVPGGGASFRELELSGGPGLNAPNAVATALRRRVRGRANRHGGGAPWLQRNTPVERGGYSPTRGKEIPRKLASRRCARSRSPPQAPKLKIPRPRLTLAFIRESVPFLRRLLGMIRPYRTRFLLGQLCGIGFALCNGAIPFLLQFVLRYALPETRVSQTAFAEHHVDEALNLPFLKVPLPSPDLMVLLACLAVPAVMILRGVFDYLNGYSTAWVSLRVLSDLRRRLFNHLTAQGLDFFGSQRAGLLISRVANDTRVAQGALSIISADLIKQPVAVVSGVVALFWLDPRFTLVSLVLFPTCILPVAIYGKRIRRASRLEEQQQGAMTVILQETFAGIRVIKSFARERFQNRQFDRLSAEQFRNSMRVRKAAEIVGPMVEVVAAIGVGLALYYVHRTGLNLSRFFSLATGLFLLYNPAKQISKLHLQIARCRAASQEIFDLLEVQATVQDRPDAVTLTGRVRGEITFETVGFSYHADDNLAPAALDGVSFHLAPGRYYALVGASGAGKSTVFALLQRFYDPGAGCVRLDGRDLRELSQESLRAQIGVVTQDNFLFHETVADNIRFGRLDATDEEVHAAAKMAHADAFIRSLANGYATVIGDRGNRLSGGQAQRLAIARAVLKDAPVLLLDEATSALDSESERAIQEALETLAEGRTVIAIAHRLSTILKADEILVLDHGRLVEQGRHADLLARPGGLYRRLYELQFGVQAEPESATGHPGGARAVVTQEEAR